MRVTGTSGQTVRPEAAGDGLRRVEARPRAFAATLEYGGGGREHVHELNAPVRTAAETLAVPPPASPYPVGGKGYGAVLSPIIRAASLP